MDETLKQFKASDANHSVLSSTHEYRRASEISLDRYYLNTETVTELRMKNRLKGTDVSPVFPFSQSASSRSLSETWPNLRFSRQFCPKLTPKGTRAETKRNYSAPSHTTRSQSSKNDAGVIKGPLTPKNTRTYPSREGNKRDFEEQKYSNTMANVKQFLEKPLPQQGPKSLRVHKYPPIENIPKETEQPILLNHRCGEDFDFGNNKKDDKDVINPNAVPSLNMFVDKPWYYQNRGKCRYLRARDDTPPPIESVFEQQR